MTGIIKWHTGQAQAKARLVWKRKIAKNFYDWSGGYTFNDAELDTIRKYVRNAAPYWFKNMPPAIKRWLNVKAGWY